MNLVFEYVIKFKDGTYYTGKAGDGMYGKKKDAFTYTEFGAYAKIRRMQWNNCTVERIS